MLFCYCTPAIPPVIYTVPLLSLCTALSLHVPQRLHSYTAVCAFIATQLTSKKGKLATPFFGIHVFESGFASLQSGLHFPGPAENMGENTAEALAALARRDNDPRSGPLKGLEYVEVDAQVSPANAKAQELTNC